MNAYLVEKQTSYSGEILACFYDLEQNLKVDEVTYQPKDKVLERDQQLISYSYMKLPPSCGRRTAHSVSMTVVETEQQMMAAAKEQNFQVDELTDQPKDEVLEEDQKLN